MIVGWVGCGLCVCGAPVAPSNDPSDWEVDTGGAYQAEISDPHFVVPADNLPAATPTLDSNNDVAIRLFEDRLFLAWRTAPTHFASAQTLMHVVSSTDGGATWDFEASFDLDTDVREPMLYAIGGRLFLTFFEAGTAVLAFEPKQLWRSERLGLGDWTSRETFGEPGEIVWDVEIRGGVAYRTSYLGSHYGSGPSAIDVRFMRSDDGLTWGPVGATPVVYSGGVSEAAFEFAADGSLWAVLRNEDGDASGFGSLLCSAPAIDLAAWDCPSTSDPERYDSPRLLRHGDDIYLIARRDIGGPYDQGRPGAPEDLRLEYWLAYSNRPKRTALYSIDQRSRRVVHLFDLPSAGDTAFPSIHRTGAHTFLVANYTSPVDDLERTWIEGQIARDGTAIYLVDLSFVPAH